MWAAPTYPPVLFVIVKIAPFLVTSTSFPLNAVNTDCAISAPVALFWIKTVTESLPVDVATVALLASNNTSKVETPFVPLGLAKLIVKNPLFEFLHY